MPTKKEIKEIEDATEKLINLCQQANGSLIFSLSILDPTINNPTNLLMTSIYAGQTLHLMTQISNLLDRHPEFKQDLHQVLTVQMEDSKNKDSKLN